MEGVEVTWGMADLTGAEPIRVPCIECEQRTNHSVAASLNCHGSSICVDYWINYQIVQCMGCETVTFLVISQHGEESDFDESGEAYIPTRTEHYPPRSAGRGEMDGRFYLPPQVQSVYSETVKALNNDQPILSGIGIRAIVESVCKEKAAFGRNLQDKIDWLVTQNILTRSDADVLHKIRALGNEAAHEARPHDAGQLALALEICEHLMKGVYLIPQYVAQKFK